MDEKEIPVEIDDSIEDEEEDTDMGFKPEKQNPIRFIPILIMIILCGIIIADYYVRDTLNGKITDKTEDLGYHYTAVIPSLENTDVQTLSLSTNILYARGTFRSIILPDSNIYKALADKLLVPDSIIIINDDISTAIEKQMQNDTLLIIATKENNEKLIYKTKRENCIKGFCLPEDESPFISFFKDRWRHLILTFE